MADTDLKIVINAEDNASGTFSSLSGKLGTLGSAASAAGKIIGTSLLAAVGAVGAFGVSSFEAAKEAQVEMTRATQALQNTFDNFTKNEVSQMKKEMADGKASFENLTAAMEASGAAALKLGFDDEEASKSFAKLFSITHDVKKSQEELALAQNLAAYSGRSLSEATDALAKVHAGGTRILKEFGLEVKDGTTAAQALALVQDKVTGSAEAMANTTQGKLNILNQSWENVKETVGDTLLTAITPFIEKLAAFAQDPQTQQKLKEIAEGVAKFAQQLAPVVEKVLPLLITLLSWVAKGLGEVAGFFFKTLPDAIGTAIFAVQQMIDKLTAFIQKIEEALSKLKNFLSTGQYSNSGASINPFSSSFKLPGFASGGVVTRPTLAMVGEGGEPEAIIPFSKLGGLGGGGVIINVYGDVSGQELVEKVQDAIVGRLNLNGKFSI